MKNMKCVTFADLAVPVIVRLTVRIIPVPSVVSIDFCTMFNVIVVVWFTVAPVLKVRLAQLNVKNLHY